MNIALLFLTGFAGGGFGSILGLGGGVIVIPILTIFLGLPIHTAVGISLVSVIATSTGAAAVYVREGQTNVRLGMKLELATCLGALLGAVIAGWVSPKGLYFLFSLMLIYNAYSMYQKDRQNKVMEHAAALNEGEEEIYTVKNLPLGFLLSVIAGILSGLLGVGGGVIIIPVMYLLMGVPLKAAAATSSFMIGVTAGASASVYFLKGMIDVTAAVPVALGVFFGIAAGTRLGRRLSTDALSKVFVILFLFIAVQMVLKGMKS